MNNIYSQIKKINENEFGSFYAYDLNEINLTIKNLKEALGEDVNLAYSLKANPNPTIVNRISQSLPWLDVSSMFELEVVKKYAIKNNKIIYTGPGKTEFEIIKAIEYEVDVIVCEDFTEVERVVYNAKKLNKIQKIAIRINPNFGGDNLYNSFANKPSPMGIDESIVFSELQGYLHIDGIDVVGFHVYIGSRNLDAESIVSNTSNIISLYRNLSNTFNKEFNFLDIGGGFGVDYFHDENPLDLSIINRHIPKLINELKFEYPNLDVFAESGRYIVANSGYMITKVISKKTSQNIEYLIVDAGISSFYLAADNLSNYSPDQPNNFPIKLIKNTKNYNFNKKELHKYNIVGPSPTTSDILAKGVCIPQVDVGDYIVIEKSGAYGPTASLPFFLGQGFPSEYLIEDNNAYIIRPRTDYNKLLRLYNA